MGENTEKKKAQETFQFLTNKKAESLEKMVFLKL